VLKTFDEASEAIRQGKLLHISGSESLLRALPTGSWIGGSTEYFLDESGGKTIGDMLDVRELNFANYKFKTYTVETLSSIPADAYSNGFSLLILPFDSAVHKEYAQNAATYADIFLSPIIGWIAGLNLEKQGQTPIAVNGQSGQATSDEAVVLHVQVPDDKMVLLNILNIFAANEASPTITFTQDGFTAKTCLVSGVETDFAKYIADNDIDTQLPLVGSYGGAGVNVSIKAIDADGVHFYAPVFTGINYQFALPIDNYTKAFDEQIAAIEDKDSVFACNCILNYLYGSLEGKDLGGFYGPITFGEIAWQLLNQTLVYLQIV
jgi:hypothetical protein